MSYVSGACDMTRWNGESIESAYERCGMGMRVISVDCGVRKFGRVEIMEDRQFTKRI